MNTYSQDRYARNFTDLNEIVDPTTLEDEIETDDIGLDDYLAKKEAEDETVEDESDLNIDCQVVRDLLEKLSTKYTKLNKINPSCADVETLLLYTEMNSWKEFQAKHHTLLAEFFDPDTREKANQFPDMQSDIVLRKQALYDRCCAKLKELRDEQKAWAIEYRENKQLFLDAKKEHLSTKKSARISKDYAERNKTANEIMDTCTVRFTELNAENPRDEIMDMEKKALHAYAELQFATKAQEGNYCIWFNRGSAKRDARAFDSIMEDLAYEYSYKLEDETKALEALSMERYTPENMENISSNWQADLQTPSEKKLQNIRDAMSLIMEEAACCTHGFNLAEQAWEPEWENDSLLVRRKDGRPNRWLTLEERIHIRRNKASTANTLPDDELFYAAR